MGGTVITIEFDGREVSVTPSSTCPAKNAPDAACAVHGSFVDWEEKPRNTFHWAVIVLGDAPFKKQVFSNTRGCATGGYVDTGEDGEEVEYVVVAWNDYGAHKVLDPVLVIKDQPHPPTTSAFYSILDGIQSQAQTLSEDLQQLEAIARQIIPEEETAS